jgi:hypothetical protein
MSQATLDELHDDVAQWLVHIFGEGNALSAAGALRKFEEEARELLDSPLDPHEAADVFISLASYCLRAGIDLKAAIAEKLAILWTREWEQRPDGTVHHVAKP